jgi:Ca-activated chloride channel homolog
MVVTARLPAAPRDGDLLRISGHATAGSWSTELPLHGTRRHSGVAALWARSRIAGLLDQERRGGDPGEVRAAVVETALAHHLVSKYTSLVAVDKTPVRPDAAALEREQVPNLLPYGQSHRAIFGFPATAAGWQSQVATGLVLVLLAWLLWAFIRRLQHGVSFDAAAAR